MSPRLGVRWMGAALAFLLLSGALSTGDRALLDAVRGGDLRTVRSLLGAGADPNTASGDGLTALHLAGQNGATDIAQVLIAAGANLHATTRIGGYTPLHLASRGGHAEVVRLLLERGSDPTAVATSTGATPLHLAARVVGGEEAVRALLEHGAPVDARESSAGQTPLMFAAWAGRAGSVQVLLEHGADPGAATEVVNLLERLVVEREAQGRLREALAEKRRATGAESLTPSELQEAIGVQREFLDSKAEIEGLLREFTPDQLAFQRPSWNTPSGMVSEVEVLGRPFVETLVGITGGMTALLHAAREGQIEAVQALLRGGAEVDQVSGDGSSPLLLALLNGHFDLAMVLLERGANPNLAAQVDGANPLFALLQTQWAPLYTDLPQPRAQDRQTVGYLEVLEALLEAGADPNVSLKKHPVNWEWSVNAGSKLGLDLTGATPFWRAAIAQDVDAMRLLARFGADPNRPTTWPEPGMRGGRQQDGRLQEDSGLPIFPEGSPNMYPIHAASGGGYLGLGAFTVNNVPNNFVNAVRYLVEEHGADVNLPDSWGYVPLHYASVRGGTDLIEYLVAQGADVTAVSRLGQSTADMARGGRAGYFSRTAFPQAVQLLESLGAPLLCLNTHFRGTGDYCPGSGVEMWAETVPEASSEPPR
jgi:ankyrin repeat protein